jgi:muramidase (phage lysozyme)
MNERQFLEKFRQTPEGQRLLKTIRFAEGTAGPKGYQTMFGGGTFSDLSRHPDQVVRRGGYASAAAGAYQFLPGTWQGQASRLGLKGFGPAEQDIAALSLARNRLMGIGGLATVQKEGLSKRVAAALSPEWASFPTESGRSYYGQPVKSLSALQQYFGSAPIQQAAAAPAAAQAMPSLGAPQISSGALTTALRKKKATSLLDTVKESLMQQIIQSAVPTVPNVFGAMGFGSVGGLF